MKWLLAVSCLAVFFLQALEAKQLELPWYIKAGDEAEEILQKNPVLNPADKLPWYIKAGDEVVETPPDEPTLAEIELATLLENALHDKSVDGDHIDQRQSKSNTFNVQITGAFTPSGSSIQATGSTKRIISNDDANRFGLSGNNLYNFAGRVMGKNPDNAYLHSVTPWNDLYATYGWPQIATTVTVQSATCQQVSVQPKAVDSKVFKNSSPQAVSYVADLSETKSNTMDSSFSVTTGTDLSVSIGIAADIVTASESITMSTSFGQTQSQSHTISITSDESASFTLAPGKSATVTLTASLGQLTCNVVYKMALSGYIAINYGNSYNGHHFWALDVNNVLASNGQPTVLTATQQIKIGFYSEGTINVQ